MGSHSEDTRRARGENFKRSSMIAGWKNKQLELRTEQAEKRNAKWQSLTPKQQLEELDRRLGKNKGAAKQRARIRKLMES